MFVDYEDSIQIEEFEFDLARIRNGLISFVLSSPDIA
jgi:hypothetical protein